MSQYEPIVNLLIQIPLVGIFIVFILEWSKRMDKAQLERDDKWRDFLREERIMRNEVIKAMTLEVHDNTVTLANITEAIAHHEIEARSRTRRIADK